MSAKQRKFIALGEGRTVALWVWTPRKGLMVVYKDGMECPSWYGSLREFLKAVKEGREAASEI